nr:MULTISPECIES: thermosome subunit alpha [Methanobrevibacter]
MMANNVNQPIFILPQGSERFKGRDALHLNIRAAKALSSIVRTTLGPKGQDKMLVNKKLNDVIVTNDGATILREMSITQPAARMLVDIAIKQEDVVGDGTTSVVIIAGELLAQAQELIDNGVPAPIVLKGYEDAKNKTLEILEDIAIEADDDEILKKVAMTAMTGKGAEYAKDHLADIVVKSCRKVTDDGKVYNKRVNTQRINGGSIDDSEVVDGLLVDNTPVDPNMETDIKDAKIALLKYPIEVRDLTMNSKIDLSSPSAMNAFLENEQEILKDLVKCVKDSGANVLMCQKGIDDMAAHYLKEAGITAFKRVKNTDMDRLEQATGGKIILDVQDLKPEHLGHAGHIYTEKIFDQEVTFFKDLEDSKACSIILRGSTRYVTGELALAMDDAMGVVSATIEDGEVVVGGGAPEIEMARRLRDYSETVSGKEQLAIKGFAKALEVVPRTLAENAGLDTVNIIAELIGSHENSNTMGLDVYQGKVVDMSDEVIEPIRVKKQAINAATEASSMIIRIDDVVAAKNALKQTGPTDDPASQIAGVPGAGQLGDAGMPPM